MWRSLKHLIGHRVDASDATFGKVKDFYFDDATWTLRYVVVDTGNWLSGRRLLISHQAIKGEDWANHTLRLALTREQIESSPPIGADKPVSRQQEEQLAQFYGWTPYWSVPPFIGGGPSQLLPNPDVPWGKDDPPRGSPPRGDPHLRSVAEMKGYQLDATDGSIGRVEDFIASDDDWSIHFVAADTRAWLSGRTVLIPPHRITAVRWESRSVAVNLAKDEVRRSPEYDPTEAVNEDQAHRLFDYFGHPRGAPAGAPRR